MSIKQLHTQEDFDTRYNISEATSTFSETVRA